MRFATWCKNCIEICMLWMATYLSSHPFPVYEHSSLKWNPASHPIWFNIYIHNSFCFFLPSHCIVHIFHICNIYHTHPGIKSPLFQPSSPFQEQVNICTYMCFFLYYNPLRSIRSNNIKTTARREKGSKKERKLAFSV